MNDMHEPTLGDVLAAVANLGEEVIGLRGEVTGLSGEITGLRGEVTGLRGEVTGLSEKQDRLRGDLMARIDRLQNVVTEQQSESSAMLELLVNSKSQADRVLTEARAALDMQNGNTTVLMHIQRKLNRLEEELRELRDGRKA